MTSDMPLNGDGTASLQAEVARLTAWLDEWRVVYRPGDELAQARARAADLASDTEPLCAEMVEMEASRADARVALVRLVEAAVDLLDKATQYGTTEDGDAAAYLLPKGAVHRLIGAVQGLAFPAEPMTAPAGDQP